MAQLLEPVRELRRRVLTPKALVWLAGALVVAAGAAVAVWLFVLRDDPEPVSVTRAVAAFRDSGGGRGEASDGVYVYETRGFEQVDALFGSRHDYPAVTTITVRSEGSCRSLRWDALAGRSTTWRICPAGQGWELAGYDEEHTFLGTTERTAWSCEGSTWLPAPARAGDPAVRTCSTEDTEESATGTVPGVGPVAVGDESVDAVQVELAATLEGRTRGTGTFDVSLEPVDGLPVTLELTNENRSNSPIGDVRYEEELTLRLESLEPRR